MYLLQSSEGNPVASFLVVIVAGIGIYFYVTARAKKLKELKEEYDNALCGADKKRALNAGRAYYAFLRKKKILTIYDEQAISNDLQSMDHSRRYETTN
jgi:uncharacterized pyridoxamine 5'-phosphate oxidase family protein